MSEKKWFETWFDSKYYHILYQHRDDKEAERFLTNLIEAIHLNSDQLILDLACGKGRHARFLNEKGFDVVGMDLSPESIEHANQFSNERLDFKVHDMRNEIGSKEFDVVLNLFTSFGYFEDTSDNIKVLNSIKNGLRSQGTVVVDFMNAHKVVDNLILEEVKELDGITFEISRALRSSSIVKEIKFKADGKDWSFTERVQALTAVDFEAMFKTVGFDIVNTFGDYSLKNFDENLSDRLIYVLQAKSAS